jgi:hypothetical protein
MSKEKPLKLTIDQIWNLDRKGMLIKFANLRFHWLSK